MGWDNAVVAFFSTAITEGVGNFFLGTTACFFGFITSIDLTGSDFFEGSPAMRTLMVCGGGLATDVASINLWREK